MTAKVVHEETKLDMEDSPHTPLSDTPYENIRSPSSYFNIFVGVMILVNSVFMGIETDHDCGVVGTALEHIFTATWAVEVVIRNIMLTPWGYFSDLWNWMDFVLAWLSIVDSWILSDGGGGLRMVSILRIFRMLRLLRLMKFLKVFRALYKIVRGLLKALSVLSWVMGLLLVVLYVAALFMTLFVGHECETTYAAFSDCNDMFGKIPSTMYTMFQVITLESWSMAVARPVLREKAYLVLIFLCFLYVTTFGLLNIVTGVIVDQTLQAAKEDESEFNVQLEDTRKERIPVLVNLFSNTDTDGSGDVSKDEFLAKCEDGAAVEEFNYLNLEVSRPNAAKRLFTVLDYENKEQIRKDDLTKRVLDLLSDSTMLDRGQISLLIELRHLACRLNALGAQKTKRSSRSSQNEEAIKAIANLGDRIVNQVVDMENAFSDRLQSIEDNVLGWSSL